MELICLNYHGPKLYDELEFKNCNLCGALYKYDSDDIEESDGILYIRCPICKNRIYVDSKVD